MTNEQIKKLTVKLNEINARVKGITDSCEKLIEIFEKQGE